MIAICISTNFSSYLLSKKLDFLSFNVSCISYILILVVFLFWTDFPQKCKNCFWPIKSPNKVIICPKYFSYFSMVVDIPRLKNLKIIFLIQGVGGGTVFQKKNYLSGDIRAQKAEKCTNNVVGKLFLPETYIFMDKIHNVMQRIPTCAIRERLPSQIPPFLMKNIARVTFRHVIWGNC